MSKYARRRFMMGMQCKLALGLSPLKSSRRRFKYSGILFVKIDSYLIAVGVFTFAVTF